MDKKITYTVIFHSHRKELGLTFLEYCIADMIYHLSNNPKNKTEGWCNASKEYLASEAGVSKQGLHKALNKMIDYGVIEKHKNRKFLKTTQKWYDTVIVNKVDNSENRVNKVDIDSKQSLPYNNIYNNKDISKDISSEVTSSDKEEFNFSERLQKLQQSSNEVSNIIAFYWKTQGIAFPSAKTYNAGYKREVRSARLLKDYSTSDIVKTVKYLQTQNFKWTLETVLKYIPNINKIKT